MNFERVNEGNLLLLISIIVMIDLVLFFCFEFSTWVALLGVEGLVISTIGAVIIAIPDVPGLKEEATPVNLREGRRTLNEEEELTRKDRGYDAILSLIQENTSRVSDKSTFYKLSIGNRPNYGSVSVRASTEPGEIPNFGLTETGYLERWIDEERDRKYRRAGLMTLASGFIFQLTSYFISNFVITG